MRLVGLFMAVSPLAAALLVALWWLVVDILQGCFGCRRPYVVWLATLIVVWTLAGVALAVFG